MTWSLFEARDQLAEQERRRQQIAAQSTAHVPVTETRCVTSAPLAAGMPAAGYAAPAMAVKAAGPDVAKRRKGKRKLEGHDLREDPATDAHEAAEGYRIELEAERAGKSFEQRGITPGPSEPVMPGKPAPENFDRDYLSAGHAAESPMSEGPRTNPVPAPYGRGFPVPIQMPGTATAGYVPVHVTESLSMGSPSDR